MKAIIEKVTLKNKNLGNGLAKCYQDYITCKNEDAPAKWHMLSKYMRVLYDNGLITVSDLSDFLTGYKLG